ncbi:MAG TPA: hypothetical protein VHC22_13435 [Pirellulales bacterium]|nr:hypothetical protein [Pirellulales bacterium]
MTEDQWMACENSEEMLESVRATVTKRKLRLFAAACFRRLTHLLTDSRQIEAIDLLEDAPDEIALPEDVVRGARLALPLSDDSFSGKCKDSDDPYFVALMLFRELRSSSTAHHATFATRGVADGMAEREQQCRLLRCICGPLPFRAIPVSPSWVTPAIVALARAIYEEQAFDKLPMLADALRQAGCHDADVLGHCKESGPHVRGCWVVDLLLT